MTALRWAGLLRELAYGVQILDQFEDQRCDVLVALHARKSFPSIQRFHCKHPDFPLIVALTGTDVYQDLVVSREAQQSVEWATRIVTLQPLASDELRLDLREKVRPIIHASRLLPAESRIQVTQVGAAMSPQMESRARKEMAENPRYKWLGDREPWEARMLQARSKLVLVTSLLEGGANVVSEAIAAGVPVIHSRIPGAVGILGYAYPGYFEVRDTAGLARLLRHVETDPTFYSALQNWCTGLQPTVTPERERDCWRSLLTELGVY